MDRNGNRYRCNVWDSTGKKLTSNEATLTVNVAFAITGQPEDVTAELGETVRFTVTAAGAVSYQWQYYDNARGKWVNSPAEGNKTATLILEATAARNGMRYRCLVYDASSNRKTSNVVTLTVA